MVDKKKNQEKKKDLKCFSLIIKSYVGRLMSLAGQRRDNFRYLEMKNYLLDQECDEPLTFF